MPNLTGKQAAFARAYVENGGNARAAYEAAGYSQNMSLETQRVNACRLLQNTNVALMVEALQKEHADRHNVTIDTITEMLKEDRELAKKQGQASAAVSASMGLAKIHGLIVDKVKGDPSAPVYINEIKMVVVDSGGSDREH